ncbi:right-handed parallel beta-helix repeat-containing protein [Ferrimonas balearica]|uniref:right-handed parallel beta-helix repeat-containing protein n=1 Tax=Ferrimonas balearica TaxID=44012 RepID=UPI001C55B20E|nr:hypothetical protein [Ferrimonas balearica]MBW3164681.1 hypothetical protein [Ferrimonas balearica]
MPVSSIFAPLALLMFALPNAAFAADTVDCASDSLQTAIDAAPAGTVLNLTGLCEGHFTIDKDLTLQGQPAVLSGTGNGAVLTLTNGSTAPRVTLRDLELRNGGQGATDPAALMNAGGLLLLNTASEPLLAQLERVTIADNTLPGNDGDAFGACGIGTAGPVQLTVLDSIISDNGIRNASLDRTVVGGILIGPQGRLTLVGSELSGNFNLTDGGGSGGLDCAGHCTMLGGSIHDNDTGSDAGSTGAGFTVQRDAFLLMDGVRVQDNRSDWDTAVAGGGVILGHAVLKNTDIRNNRIVPTGDTDGSGGLLVQGGVLEMIDGSLRGNLAPGSVHRGAAGLTVRSAAQASLLRTTIRDNQALAGPDGSNAGAVLVSDDSRFYGDALVIRANEGQAGAMRIGAGSRAVLNHSRVQSNVGLVTGGILLDGSASPVGEVLLFDTRVFGNSPDNCSGFSDPACD